MPRYTIEQYETWAQTYVVEADSKAKAIHMVLNGEAEAIDNGLEYIMINEELGLSKDQCEEGLLEELESLDVVTEEWGVPSIRSIEEE